MLAKGSHGFKSMTTAEQAERLARRIEAARGDCKADFVIRNATWLDVFSGAWQSGDVAVADGIVVGVKENYDAQVVIDGSDCFLVPGFIDAHVHIESSMMTPSRFSMAVMPRGTTTVIWDPHEIANVKGIEGIRWALESTEDLPIDVFVMVPSCVPSTSPELGLESSGAELKAIHLKEFVTHPRVLGLAEMMNWPGLIGADADVLDKLTMFSNLRRDGHCPGLSGKELNAYGVAGIHSCHESTSHAEGSEKLSKGIHVLIREGSCAKDADTLLPLLNHYSSATLGYCSDDRNPLDIEESGHLDCIINKALIGKLDPIAVFRAASFAVAKMYGLEDRGAVAPGYKADLVLVKPRDLDRGLKSGVDVKMVWQGGFESRSLLNQLKENTVINEFSGRNLKIKKSNITAEDFKILSKTSVGAKARVIGVRPGQIVTDELILEVEKRGQEFVSKTGSGLNKIAVIERHQETGFMCTAFVHGFNLTSGAIATSINHDSHNVIVTGSNDELMALAVGKLREIDGGIVVISGDGEISHLELPIGGLMTNMDPNLVAERLRILKKHAKKIGCKLEEPFLQLSFLALPVIPNLKVTDRGLVDAQNFRIVPVII